MATTVAQQVPASLNIECYGGDNLDLTLSFQVDDGSGGYVDADFTGCSAKMQIKHKRNLEAVIALASPSTGLSFPSSSQIKISLTPSQTFHIQGFDMVYDLQVTDTLGSVRTYIAGFFITKQETTT